MVVTPAGAVMPSDCENAVPVCRERAAGHDGRRRIGASFELPTSALSNAAVCVRACPSR